MMWWSLILLFFLSTFPALAVTITLSNVPSSISTDPFTLNVDISGPNPGTNYLRVDLFKDGTSNYFGETNNGSVYYGGSDGLQYFPVTINAEGTASAQLTARIGNPSHTDYPGSGQYKLKIRRYTSADSNSSSNSNDVQITFDWPTPTPTSTPQPTSPPAPTNTPAPTTTPKLSSTPKPSATPTPKPTSPPITVTVTLTTPQVLAEATEFFTNSSPTPIPVPESITDNRTPNTEHQSPPWPAFLLIGLGAGGLAASAYLFFRSRG
ncbi:MAG: gamete and mating-type specific protein A [Microgenomates group bacterium Gr01-1014_16]|nr:MAG: gamete and mating-type specific protein A [Microgenomates group bacterium Gr01-1014_16]